MLIRPLFGLHLSFESIQCCTSKPLQTGKFYTLLKDEFFLRDSSRLYSHFSPFYRIMYIVCYITGGRETSAILHKTKNYKRPMEIVEPEY